MALAITTEIWALGNFRGKIDKVNTKQIKMKVQ